MIIRTYSCLNRNCRHEFNSDGDFPPCPRCRSLRVQWVPRPVNINSERTRNIDATARQLAADHGLTNYRSPMAGQAAIAPPAAQGINKRNTFEPAKGWRIELPDDAISGTGHSVCAPTGVTSKVKIDPNSGSLKENPGYGLDRMRAVTQFEGTHKGQIPK